MDIEEQYNKIYRYCYMKTRDHHTSEDLTQETFLHFLENHSYREIGKQMAYLYMIARNLCNDYYRSGARNEILTENKQEKEDISSNTSFEQVEIFSKGSTYGKSADHRIGTDWNPAFHDSDRLCKS